ncbi:MAG: right-handed parallel beta-helix repeat-containing protein [Nitrospirota bacterium]
MRRKQLQLIPRGFYLIRIFLLSCLLALPAIADAAKYYVRPAGEVPNGDGLSYETAWAGLSNIRWFDQDGTGIQAGDKLYVCGTHTNSFLEINGSGADKHIIVIDGRCRGGENGVITGALNLSSESDWTYIGSNKWATGDNTFSSRLVTENEDDEWYYKKIPGWVLLEINGEPACDTSDFNMCPSANGESSTDGATWWDPQSQDEYDQSWEYSIGRMIMYMSPDAGGNPRNPASVYSKIFIPNQYAGIYAYGYSYVTIQNISLQYIKNHGIWMRNVEHFNVLNASVTSYGGGKSESGSSNSGNGIMFDGNSHDGMVKSSYVAHGLDVGLDVELYKSFAEQAYNITFKSNTVEYCGGGIAISAHKATASHIYNITVKGNTFRNIGMGWSGSVLTSSHGKGISLKELNSDPHPELDDILIENNIIDGYTWTGINMWEGNAVIKGNVIMNGTAEYGNDGYSKPTGILIHGGDYVNGNSEYEATGLIHNNLIFNNLGHGIFIINNTPDPVAAGYVEIYNNTLFNNGSAAYPSFYTVTSSGTIFKNNIVHSTDSLCFSGGAYGDGTTESDYNLFYKADGGNAWKWSYKTFSFDQFNDYKSFSGQDQNSLAADPLFIDQLSDDFHLQPISPAIDAGIDVGLSSDFDGNLIPCLSTNDIGAYEYCN